MSLILLPDLPLVTNEEISMLRAVSVLPGGKYCGTKLKAAIRVLRGLLEQGVPSKEIEVSNISLVRAFFLKLGLLTGWNRNRTDDSSLPSIPQLFNLQLFKGVRRVPSQTSPLPPSSCWEMRLGWAGSSVQKCVCVCLILGKLPSECDANRKRNAATLSCNMSENSPFQVLQSVLFSELSFGSRSWDMYWIFNGLFVQGGVFCLLQEIRFLSVTEWFCTSIRVLFILEAALSTCVIQSILMHV